MTSPAIKLARECDAKQEFDFESDTPLMAFCELLVAKAQAQALHQWAKEAEGYTNPLKLANYMDAAADELERKA